MELKKLVSQFAYRIEPKPDGGFIAHASDPSVPPLEAPSRQELLKLIQDRVLADLATEFPGLKLPPDGTRQQFAFHVERTPEGGFSIHSADPNADVVHGATENDIQSHFLEKLLNLAGKHVMPELAQALAAQGTGNIKVVINRKTSIRPNAGSHQVSPGLTKDLPPPAPIQSAGAAPQLDPAGFANRDLSNSIGTIDGTPITPEPSNLGTFFRLLVPLFIVAALIYFFFTHH